MSQPGNERVLTGGSRGSREAPLPLLPPLPPVTHPGSGLFSPVGGRGGGKHRISNQPLEAAAAELGIMVVTGNCSSLASTTSLSSDCAPACRSAQCLLASGF